MEYIYASMLLHKAGKPITEENIKKILEAAGANIDEARIKAVLAALEEINIDEAIKTATVPVAAATPAPAEATAPEAKEEKKEEKKEEEEEEEVGGLGALFG
ncbi:MAG: 50S ribosomal protein P1 [Candidatus Baldrarchaeia archaeon]